MFQIFISSWEEGSVDSSARTVVQPIKTKTGRIMFQFKTGETEPCVGDLRQALKRKRYFSVIWNRL